MSCFACVWCAPNISVRLSSCVRACEVFAYYLTWDYVCVCDAMCTQDWSWRQCRWQESVVGVSERAHTHFTSSIYGNDFQRWHLIKWKLFALPSPSSSMHTFERVFEICHRQKKTEFSFASFVVDDRNCHAALLSVCVLLIGRCLVRCELRAVFVSVCSVHMCVCVTLSIRVPPHNVHSFHFVASLKNRERNYFNVLCCVVCECKKIGERARARAREK